MPTNPEQDDPQRAERFAARLTKKLTDQAAELATKSRGRVTPAQVATIYLDTAIALALLAGTPPRDVAQVLRNHADRVQREAGGALGSRN